MRSSGNIVSNSPSDRSRYEQNSNLLTSFLGQPEVARLLLWLPTFSLYPKRHHHGYAHRLAAEWRSFSVFASRLTEFKEVQVIETDRGGEIDVEVSLFQ